MREYFSLFLYGVMSLLALIALSGAIAYLVTGGSVFYSREEQFYMACMRIRFQDMEPSPRSIKCAREVRDMVREEQERENERRLFDELRKRDLKNDSID